MVQAVKGMEATPEKPTAGMNVTLDTDISPPRYRLSDPFTARVGSPSR